jgi:hypothetical protein
MSYVTSQALKTMVVQREADVLGPEYERQQRPRNSEEFLTGSSQGDLGNDLWRGWQSSP